MVAGSSSWREADRADRERYLHPSRTQGLHSEPSSSTGCAAPRPLVKPAETYYDVLGVDRSASAAEVRRAYRRLLVTAHPDKGGPRERFEQLQAAFAVLSDAGERLIYDEKLERVLGASSGSSGGAGGYCDAAAASDKVQRTAAGVIAVVHGQTQGDPQQQQGQQRLPPTGCRRRSDGSKGELDVATAAIIAAQAERGPRAAAGLAAAYLARAAVHRAAGQLHHALFDAEEALRVHPDFQEATMLLEELTAAVAAADRGETVALQQGHSSSSGSSDEDSEDVF